MSEDKGTRRYMEDSHSFVVDYAGVRGQGFFAVFDGHAGKHAAEWCGQHFHEVCLLPLAPRTRSPKPSIRSIFLMHSAPHPPPPFRTSSTKPFTTSTDAFLILARNPMEKSTLVVQSSLPFCASRTTVAGSPFSALPRLRLTTAEATRVHPTRTAPSLARKRAHRLPPRPRNRKPLHRAIALPVHSRPSVAQARLRHPAHLLPPHSRHLLLSPPHSPADAFCTPPMPATLAVSFVVPARPCVSPTITRDPTSKRQNASQTQVASS